MYGVWNSDADANRRKARIELIQFLLQENAVARAESELIALASSLPRILPSMWRPLNCSSKLRTTPARVLSTRKFCTLIPPIPSPSPERAKPLTTSATTLLPSLTCRRAVSANPQDLRSRQLLADAELVLRVSPFRTHISDAERNRRIVAAFTQAEGV